MRNGPDMLDRGMRNGPEMLVTDFSFAKFPVLEVKK
jgi:hypothetical protein